MPQTSLSAWLSKPTLLQEPTPVKLANHGMNVDDSTRQPIAIQPKGTTQVDRAPAIDTPENAHGTKQAKGKRDLPPNVELRACRKEDIAHLKRLNSLLLPIPYPESFYREIIEDSLTSSITLVAVWHDDPSALGKEKGRLVGAIRCRILAHPPSAQAGSTARKDGPMLYLSTVVLLSPYRSYGIANLMLEILMKRTVKDHGVTSVGAHVWEANVDGLEWYQKRGFREVGKEANYYQRLKPPGAVVVQRDISVVDLLNG